MRALLNRLHDEHLCIFLFHGVVEEQTSRIRNYTQKHLSRCTFMALMNALGTAGRPISMDQVLEHVTQCKRFPKRSFAITFDDGFENNASVAAPILDALAIPATFYVTTGFVDEGRMSWIDRLEFIFEAAGPLRLRLPWRSAVVEVQDDTSKIHLLTEIRREVKQRPDIDPEVFADEIAHTLGVPVPTAGAHSLDKKLSWEQLRQLAAHPLFTVGGHTHSHAILSRLTEPHLAHELDTSLTLLREKAGVGPRHYSYPEGQAEHFSPSVIEALKSRGVVCCPTAIDGVNSPDTDPFSLRRIMVDQVCVA